MSTIDTNTQAKINQWLGSEYDQETVDQVRRLIDQNEETELIDSFYRDLEFGTGGLRGIMGVGSNRMNKYTIGKATQGLANYLKKQFPGQEIKVAVSYDSRNNSQSFGRLVADVFAANGIKVYLFSELRPTPVLSFAIRHFGCQSGVMLTASHNPKEYNGYKAYWNDGCQLTAPHDKNVIDEVNAIASVNDIKFEAIAENIIPVGTEIDEAYIKANVALSINPEVVKAQKDLKIVFSPIHGTGITIVPQLLRAWGFDDLILVEEQATPNGNFPTVIYPNPEEEDAMAMAKAKGEATDADLVLATDPDADRVGVAVKNNAGKFELLNGNQIGSLLIYYVLSAKKEQNKLSETAYIVKTIVTTNLQADIAAHSGVKHYETLTGFKYIGELMTKLLGKEEYLAGGEESYGYLVGDLVRDKDAPNACAFLAEMTAYFKNKGKSVYDVLMDIYQEFGCYREKLVSLTKKGKAGAEEIAAMMVRLRENMPNTLGGITVKEVRDYQNSVSILLATGEKKAIDLPKSDVLQFITVEGDVISARPSGTEPKIKFYCSVKEPLNSVAEYQTVSQRLEDKVEKMMADII
ncbi:phospho-sugar mutase [Sphingobacterium spiritivorum]|uniref:Phosphoglucomutase/phosphomannomutase, alpha/beta/alpha domain II n=1 Tax=Sphingobacterium spiritivorum ATCC 33861 TaxID=525373 RepID=D7VIQ6_SPHSI|nr:phospho-sugar mutase [Sphingobacterium spiritivorum]EFK59958.1 phosphoglucomutase/phosphomannomutase, alpha/beta/alpha domain II [Sphingobacterium spiritivorum ATCC 33861]QQT37409.1 phospho-sugar mutase [Sphingobacterium spiritivorum]WQD34201.1 phospho-sugar mutase [Sphingobacterium spiritivorum]SUI97024.1 Phosphoglucomutase [Sphingobacterium spiritivorum]